MITVRQIERLWEARRYESLTAELLTNRAEHSPRLLACLTGLLPAAALALIRLDELNQAHVSLTKKLIHRLLLAQGPDGGWDDPLITALCTRALMTSSGHGLAIDRALQHLADLQKSEGIWPREAVRRLCADSFVSAFILYELSASEQFRQRVRLGDAVSWFDANEPSLDAETRRLWKLAALKCRPRRTEARAGAMVWS